VIGGLNSEIFGSLFIQKAYLYFYNNYYQNSVMENTTMCLDTVHCKISYDGQIRRFVLDNTEFASLKDAIPKLLSIKDEFVLKYLDDESDYVTLDNQEALQTALMISPEVLRLLVEPKNEENASGNLWQSRMYRKRGHYNKERKGRHDRPHFNAKSTEHRKQREEKKLAFITQALADLGTDDSALNPRDLLKKQKLNRKKQILESCSRGECFNQRKKRGLLSPEDLQNNLAFKAQILAVKIEESKVKSREIEIKKLMQEAVQQGGDQKALKDELSSLKEQLNLLRTQKRDLHDRAHLQ
jgi:hypothetical protein